MLLTTFTMIFFTTMIMIMTIITATVMMLIMLALPAALASSRVRISSGTVYRTLRDSKVLNSRIETS